MFELALIVSSFLSSIGLPQSSRAASNKNRRARIPRPRRRVALGLALGRVELEALDPRLLLSNFQVTIAGQDNNDNPVPGTLRWAKREVDYYAQQGVYYNIQLDVSPVLILPLYMSTPVTIYGQGNAITESTAQPIAVIGQAPVTFHNVVFNTSGGSAAVTDAGQLDLEQCITNGPIQATVTVPCSITVNSTTFANIPANAGPAAYFAVSAGDQVNFTGNAIVNSTDQQFAYAGPSNALLTFFGNTIAGNNVNSTAAGITINGPANVTNDNISNNVYAGPIMGIVVNAGQTDNFNTVYVNGDHSGTTTTAVGGALVVQNNGGTFSVKNTTTSFNTIVGGSLWNVQGSTNATTAFVNMAIVYNTAGGIYSAIPIAISNAVFCNNVGFGINALLINNALASSGYIDVGVLLGTASGYPPHSTNVNPLVDGLVNGLTLQVMPTSPLATFGSDPNSGQKYLGYNTTFN